MVEEISGSGQDRLDRLSPGERAKAQQAGRAADAPRSDRMPEVVVSSELRELIERVKQAETFRKERVHEVLEKLQRGELVTSEAVREAAEKILRDGA
jgi:restriction endonuclease